jgi:hypothetical protein
MELTGAAYAAVSTLATTSPGGCLSGKACAALLFPMVDRIVISPAQLARLEANQRELYVEALAGIAEALRSARDRANVDLPHDKPVVSS